MSIKPSTRGKEFWGPPIWRLGHIFGITYDRSKAANFENFWVLLTVLLPCDYCQKNLSAKLKQYPIKNYLKNKETAFFYTYFVHDLANCHITKHHPEKPKISPDYDSIKEYYMNNVNVESFWKEPFWDTLFILW